MKVPFLNLKLSDSEVEEEIKKSVLEVIDRKDFILGREVVEFEKKFADYIGTNFAVGVSSGTSALLISLKSLGIKSGDKVITTPFTFTATGEVIAHCGAVPMPRLSETLTSARTSRLHWYKRRLRFRA
ncbi:MAG: DegT/DnrJ/EryC1/StrS family aminotransferase, partial [Endomicrobiia bacterium]